jgi:hypothetical protein
MPLKQENISAPPPIVKSHGVILEQFTFGCNRRCDAPDCGIEADKARRIKNFPYKEARPFPGGRP